MITCTSEISGRASSGMCPMDQIPAMTRRNVPVKTRNRLWAHHSMIQLITLHSSCCVHTQVFAGDDGAVLKSRNRHLPSAARLQLSLTFIEAVPFVRQINGHFHRGHSHCGHGSHVEREAYLRAA